MKTTTMGGIVAAMMLAACGGVAEGGSPGSDVQEPQRTADAADAAPSYACTGDPNAATAPVQASAQATACLHAMCRDAATCGEVTADFPVCVPEYNGGITRAWYVCPRGCCY